MCWNPDATIAEDFIRSTLQDDSENEKGFRSKAKLVARGAHG